MTSPDPGVEVDPVPGIDPRKIQVVETTSNSITIKVSDFDPRLYHYTSGAGLQGILNNRELWATHIYYLNDHSEYVGTFDKVKHLLQGRVVIRNLLPSVPHLHKAVMNLHPYERGRMPCFIVICFSEEWDDLSQWRGYTKPGDGYALGFDRARLETLAEAAGYRLVKVEYGEERAAAAEFRLIPLLQDLFTRYADAGPDTPERAEEAVESLRLRIQQFAPFMKDWAFHGENEWRLISPIYDASTTNFEFRQGASFLVPYVKFDLGYPGGADELFTEIVVGPGPNIDLAKEAALILARQNGLNIDSHKAQVPYRPW